MAPDLVDILEDESFGTLYQVWQRARSGTGLPHQRDIRMQDLAQFAEHLLIYHWDRKGRLTCRLMGDNVAERVKIYRPDINWMELVSRDMIPASTAWWNAVYDTPCAGAMHYSFGYIDGTNRIGQSLYLPVLRQRGETHIMAMNVSYGIYRVDAQRDMMVIGADCLMTSFIDVGFGIPKGRPHVTVHKRLDGELDDPQRSDRRARAKNPAVLLGRGPVSREP